MIAWLRGLRPGSRRRHAPVAESVEARLLFSADLGGVLGVPDATGPVDLRTLDGEGEYGTGAMLVAAAAASPVATDDSFTTPEGIPLMVRFSQLLDNDTGSSLEVVDIQPGAGGGVEWLGGGNANVLRFTPALGFTGTASFTYVVSDGTTQSTATVFITVTPLAANQTPVGMPDTLDATEDVPANYTADQLLGNDSDPDGHALAIDSVGGATGGTVVLNADGSVTFTPNLNFHGAAGFWYTVTDGDAASGQVVVTVNVQPVNDAPAGGADNLAGVEDTPLTIAPGSLLANDSDSEGSALSISSVQAVTGGTVILNGDGSITFRPDAGFSGPASFTYTVTDGALSVVVPVAIDIVAQDVQVTPAPPAPPVAGPPAPVEEAPAPAPAPAGGSPAPEPAPASGPVVPTLPPVTAAPAEAGGSGTPPRAPRPAESLQDALGAGMESPIAALNEGEMAFGAPAAPLALQAEGSRAAATVVFDRAGFQLVSAQGTDFALRNFGLESGSDGARLEDFQRSIRSEAFASELDRLREAVRDELNLEKSVTISVVSVSLGLSFVYVLWLIRGGVLLGSYLSALPAWRMLDPLPVLARGDGEAEEDDEALAVEDAGSRSRSTLRGFG